MIFLLMFLVALFFSSVVAVYIWGAFWLINKSDDQYIPAIIPAAYLVVGFAFVLTIVALTEHSK